MGGEQGRSRVRVDSSNWLSATQLACLQPAEVRMQQQHPVVPQSQSASSLLFSSRHAPRFSSGCPSLDALLTPPSSTTLGLAHGSVLELLGPPGIGKTRTALGFVLSARFEALELGKEGDVLVVGEFTALVVERQS